MGHCNMLLAVAGLDKPGVEARTRRLAVRDWSAFAPAERAALAFAHRTARSVATLPQDFRRLAAHLGPERALDVLWWVCHCHYMTRVADAFQLPLERGNVFDGFLGANDGPTGRGSPGLESGR